MTGPEAFDGLYDTAIAVGYSLAVTSMQGIVLLAIVSLPILVSLSIINETGWRGRVFVTALWVTALGLTV